MQVASITSGGPGNSPAADSMSWPPMMAAGTQPCLADDDDASLCWQAFGVIHIGTLTSDCCKDAACLHGNLFRFIAGPFRYAGKAQIDEAACGAAPM